MLCTDEGENRRREALAHDDTSALCKAALSHRRIGRGGVDVSFGYHGACARRHVARLPAVAAVD